jgi:hypothetical protein
MLPRRALAGGQIPAQLVSTYFWTTPKAEASRPASPQDRLSYFQNTLLAGTMQLEPQIDADKRR